MAKTLVLASQSPRRRQLMGLVTPHFEVDSAAIAERQITAETPAALAGLLAAHKAQAVFARRGAHVVIGCDTVVELGGKVLGKPQNAAEASDMLHALSGKGHQVHTGVAIYASGVQNVQFVETTKVTFASIPAAEIAAYVQTPEPYDKAGGYGIQGWAARFVPKVQGCYYNVMGLPVAALWQALRQLDALPGATA